MSRVLKKNCKFFFVGKFYNGTFFVVQTKSMFIYARLSAPKMFAKFECQTQTFCNKKDNKAVKPSLGQTDYSATLFC